MRGWRRISNSAFICCGCSICRRTGCAASAIARLSVVIFCFQVGVWDIVLVVCVCVGVGDVVLCRCVCDLSIFLFVGLRNAPLAASQHSLPPLVEPALAAPPG